MRALRCEGVDFRDLPRADLCAPSCDPYHRFRADQLDLDLLRLATPPTNSRPLNVAVPSHNQSVRAGFAHNTVLTQGSIPRGSFLEVGGGLQIPGPELLFLLMGTKMAPIVHLAFGIELCGTYSRDAQNPSDAEVSFRVPPATSQNQIDVFLRACRNVKGIRAARHIAPLICDNAWSPMEGSTTAVFSLPVAEMGYGLAPITLNERRSSASDLPNKRGSRVPDILFAGTHVGFNYDGGEHLDLGSIVQAATHSALNPESRALSNALQTTVATVRTKYVDDRRRDRELWAQGFEVMPITIEDLAVPGGCDGLATWAIDRIEAEGTRVLGTQREALESEALREIRQQVVWSLLPGERGRRARAFLASRSRGQ